MAEGGAPPRPRDPAVVSSGRPGVSWVHGAGPLSNWCRGEVIGCRPTTVTLPTGKFVGRSASISSAAERRRNVTGRLRGRLELLCVIAMLALVVLVNLLSDVARRQLAR
jgi:hypothetical protein